MKLIAVTLARGAGHLVRPVASRPRRRLPRRSRAWRPAAPSAWPFEFRWKGAGPKTVVRIQVVDEAERPLAGLEGRGDRLAAPDGLKSMLRAGLRYQWRVARVDENGEEVGASALTAFN